MKAWNKFLFLSISIVTFYGCSQKEREVPNVSKVQVDVKFERLCPVLEGIENRGEVADFLDNNPIIKAELLKKIYGPYDSLVVDGLYNMLKDSSFLFLKEESNRIFGDFSQLEKDFVAAFKYIKYYDPEFTPPRVQFVYTGFGFDMFFSDTLVIVSMENYLGSSSKLRPLNMPKYMLTRYEPHSIVTSVVLILSQKYIDNNFKEESLLSDMVFYGKAYTFAKAVLPKLEEYKVMGYTSEEWSDCKNNTEIIWNHFVQKKLLYESSPSAKTRYIDERPQTFEVGEKCPGRIGQWLGWQIVNSYWNENRGVTLQEVLSNTDSQELFRQSKYKPGHH